MPDDAVTGLLREAVFSFVGTVERVGAATMEQVPIDERTTVIHVDQVLHAPDAFAQLAGNTVTLQPSLASPALEVGDSAAFFANGLAFGDSVALAEVGRLPVADVEPHVSLAAGEGAVSPFAALQSQVESDRLREHVSEAEAVVLARVMKLEKATGPPTREHDPDWWCATLEVVHVEKGDVPEGEVRALYANSLDVRWRDAPKPKAAQNGLWVLHATEGDLREVAPFQILHSADFQPVQHLDSLRDNGS